MSSEFESTETIGTHEATRACLYAVVERFNTEDPFWGAFVPESDSTFIGDDFFSVSLLGGGVRIIVKGTMRSDGSDGRSITPSLVVGAQSSGDESEAPSRWYTVTCNVDESGHFVTSNFRNAIEAAVGAI